MIEKKCSKCHEIFPATKEFFSPHESCLYGLLSYCRKCDNKKRSAYHAAHREERAEYDKQYRVANKKHLREVKFSYYLRNQEKFIEKAKVYYRTRGVLYDPRFKILKDRNLPIKFSKADKTFCLSWWENKCPYCYKSLKKYEIEHFIPVSSDKCIGHIPMNILLSCKECNRNKSARNPEEWLFDKFEENEAYLKLEKIMNYFDKVSQNV